MKNKTENDMVILPKGTVFNINGFCGEFLQDTPVLSPDIKKYGLENVNKSISDIPACNQRFYKNPNKKDDVEYTSLSNIFN